jgi:hypothetical protein
VPGGEDSENLFDAILHLLNTHPGNCDIALELLIESNILVCIKPVSQLRVGRSAELESALQQLGCTARAERART